MFAFKIVAKIEGNYDCGGVLAKKKITLVERSGGKVICAKREGALTEIKITSMKSGRRLAAKKNLCWKAMGRYHSAKDRDRL